jgi:integration host factor subunit beta
MEVCSLNRLNLSITETFVVLYLNKMTKQQVIEAVANKTERAKADVEVVLDSILEVIVNTLQTNERVDLRGFGSFAVKEKKARQGRNPRTGEAIAIAAKRDASFKPSKELSKALTDALTPTEAVSVEPPDGAELMAKRLADNP